MFHISTPPPRKEWIAALASLACLCGSAKAQNFTLQVTDSNPLGLGDFVPSGSGLDMDLEGTIKGAFAYGVGATTEYNSNFYLTENDEQSEVSVNFAPWINYVSDPEGGADISLSARYNPTIRCYLEDSDLNGVDQSGDFALQLRGTKTEIAVFGRMSQFSGTDRLTGDFVEGTVMTGGIRGNRQIAPRTSLNASWTASKSDYGSGTTDEGAEIYTANLGGMWQATERLAFGPTVRYTTATSDLVGTWDAWALLLDANYKVGERIQLSASLGPEFSENSGDLGEGTSVGLTGSLAASYAINERWTWVNRIRSATVPSPNETNYMVTNVGLSTLLNRQFTRCSAGVGMELNLSEYEEAGTVTINRGNEQNMSVFLTYNRNLVSDRIGLNSTLRYAFNEGQTDWSQILFSLGVNVAF